MNDEKFLLVSLKEDKAKKLAQIVSNDTCRKIIDLLAQKEATESEIAKELKIAISTVHYNLQQLIKSKLVVAEEFHYSKKGKEINHYKLANKYIIIAPKETSGIRAALKKILPIGIITLVSAAIIKFFTLSSGATLSEAAPRTILMQDAVTLSAKAVPEIAAKAPFWQDLSFIVLIAGLIVIVGYLIVKIIKNK